MSKFLSFGPRRPDKQYWLGWQWRLIIVLRRMGRGRVLLLLMVIAALGWHLMVSLPQQRDLQNQLHQLQLTLKKAPVHRLVKPQPEMTYGERYAQILAVLQQHGLSADKMGFSQGATSDSRVYALNLVLAGDYRKLYQAMDEVQKKSLARVLSLRMERDNEQSDRIQAQVRFAFSVKR